MGKLPRIGCAVLAALAVLVPFEARGQVEIGMDAGLTITSIDEADDDTNAFSIPVPWVRLGLPVGEALVFEPIVSFQRISSGDNSLSTLVLLPGLSLLLGDADDTHFYLRGEGGLNRTSFGDGDDDDSETQFGVGGAAGIRSPIGGSGLVRVEGGFDVFFEKTENDFVTARGYKEFRILVGLSLVVD